jgi:hypothetical protein
MTASFSEMHERLKSATLREIILLVAGGVNGWTFNEIAAVRERLLDIAFRDEAIEFEQRSLAAAWSRTVDSVIMILLENKPETRDTYVRARNVSMEEVLKFGFGSIGNLAVSDPQALMQRLSFSNEEDESTEQTRSLRSHLTSTAFGITDVSTSQGAD